MKKLWIGTSNNKWTQGYVTVDIDKSKNPDIVADIMNIGFDNESLNEIRSHHFIEHIRIPQAEELFKRCYKWLKKGGLLITEFPDMNILAKMIRKEPERAIYEIYGNQINDWQFHKYGYTKETFTNMVEKIGFNTIKIRKDKDTSCIITAQK